MKIKEKDILYEKVEVHITMANGDKTVEIEPTALSARFFMKCINVLNSRAAKNWLKFDCFLEVIQCFAIGDPEYKPSAANE